MEQTYTLELKDYLQFQAFLIKRTPQHSRRKIVLTATVPLIVAAGIAVLALEFSVRNAPFPIASASIGWAVISLLWTLYIQWAYRKAMASQVKMSVGSVGLFTVAISPEMLRVDSPISETRIRWEKISEVTESASHLMFLFGPVVGYIIPKNAFRDADHAREFLETARAYKNGMLLDTPETNTAWPPPPRRQRD